MADPRRNDLQFFQNLPDIVQQASGAGGSDNRKREDIRVCLEVNKPQKRLKGYLFDGNNISDVPSDLERNRSDFLDHESSR